MVLRRNLALVALTALLALAAGARLPAPATLRREGDAVLVGDVAPVRVLHVAAVARQEVAPEPANANTTATETQQGEKKPAEEPKKSGNIIDKTRDGINNTIDSVTARTNLPRGLVIGIAIGAVVLVFLLIGCCCCCCCRKG